MLGSVFHKLLNIRNVALLFSSYLRVCRTRSEHQAGNFYSCTVKLEKFVYSSLCLSVCLCVKLSKTETNGSRKC